MGKNTLDIGEVAQHSGLPTSTLRYYEQKGLIQSTGRNGLRRLFNADVLNRLALITLGRHAGFSLDEITTMFTPSGPQINRNQLLAKADELDANIKRLTDISNGLRHAAACDAPSHMECPTFQRLLKTIGNGRNRQRLGSTKKFVY